MTNKIDKVKDCQKQEAAACNKKIEKFKEVYKKLKCSICDQRGDNK